MMGGRFHNIPVDKCWVFHATTAADYEIIGAKLDQPRYEHTIYHI